MLPKNITYNDIWDLIPTFEYYLTLKFRRPTTKHIRTSMGQEFKIFIYTQTAHAAQAADNNIYKALANWVR